MRLSNPKHLSIALALLGLAIAGVSTWIVVDQRSESGSRATRDREAQAILAQERSRSVEVTANALALAIATGDQPAIEKLLGNRRVFGAYVTDDAGRPLLEREAADKTAPEKTFVLENGWTVTLFVDPSDAKPELASTPANLSPIILLILALLVSALALAAIVSNNRLREPLQELAKRAKRIAQGDFSKVDAHVKSEVLGDLAAEFESMREQLLATTITRDFLDAMFNNMREIVIVTRANGQIQRVNQAAIDLLEQSEEDLVDRNFMTIVSLDARRRTDFSEPQSTAKETVLVSKSGKRVPVSFTSSLLRDDEGDEAGRVFVAQDISERKKAEQRIRYLARVDPLTKLPNRMQFQHLLQQGIARARRSRRYLALMYIDVDHFKDINDTFGHAAGDACLETFAERINDHLPAGAIAGRLAGDEFALLLTGFVQMDGLVQQVGDTTRQLLNTIGEPFSVQGQEIFVTASIGIALHPIDADNVIDLIRNADAALYQAKRAAEIASSFTHQI